MEIKDIILVKIIDVGLDDNTHSGIVVLSDMTDTKVIPIWIGLFETQAIITKLSDIPVSRPLTHDLFYNCLTKLSVKIDKIVVNTIIDNTYYAQIHVLHNDHTIVLDSRPSDAIAIALRSSAPIYVSKEVYNHGYDKEQYERMKKVENYQKISETENDKNKQIKH